MNFNFWSLCLLYPNNWTDFQCHPALAKSPFLDWSRLTWDSNVDSTLRPEGWEPRCRTWYTWFARCLNRTWRSRFARSTFCYRRLRTMPKSCHPDQRPKLWRGLDERWSFAFCSPLAFHTLPSVRFWCQPQSGDFGYNVRFEGRNKWDWRLRSSIEISSGYDRCNVKWYPQRQRVSQPNQTFWAQWGPEKLRF